LKKRLSTLCHITTVQKSSSLKYNLDVSRSDGSDGVAKSNTNEMPVRKELKMWRCGRCPYAIQDIGHFRRHVSMHGRCRLHQCTECNYSTLSYWQVAQHRQLHSNVRSQSLVNLTQCSHLAAENEKSSVTKDDTYVESQLKTMNSDELCRSSDCDDERCALSDDEVMRRMDCQHDAKRLLGCEHGILIEACKCCRCCVAYDSQQATINQMRGAECDDNNSSVNRWASKSMISVKHGVGEGQRDCVLTCSSQQTTLLSDERLLQTKSEAVSYNCHISLSTSDPSEEVLNGDDPSMNEHVTEVQMNSSDLMCVYCGWMNDSLLLLSEHESSHFMETSSHWASTDGYVIKRF
jgi:hypothetical protein